MNTIVFIGSGAKDYRYYILEEAKKLGLYVLLLNDQPLSWESEYIDEYIKTDLTSEELITNILRKHPNKIKGITTYVEGFVPITATICKRFNLVGLPPKASMKVRNKYMMRKCFFNQNVPSPKVLNIQNTHDIENAGEKIDFPVVFKPAEGWSSIGVVKIENSKDLLYEYSQQSSLANEFLIEEYIEGPEFSVEGIVQGGEIHTVGVTQKYLSNEPYFEEVGHDFPATLSSEKFKEILRVASKGVKALDIDDAPFHAELRLTKKGPVVIEIAARLGGDCIPLLVNLSYGINLARESIKLAIGEKLNITKVKNNYSSIRIITPYKTGVIEKIPEPSQELKENSNLIDFRVHSRCKVGEYYHTPPDGYFSRLGYFIMAGEGKDIYEKASQLGCQIQMKIK
ncbi:ATP-grasp domain-containing protein [Halalkalibacterium halodurans]|uniref:ATP-grasp domain-containing protein n=1 Tax=Halalkalibacterium halodurans TaxID=86665 RepID=UPI002E234134|nr:ATP-grasp domain-containing protein [Halalkalibacterium halodurans]